MILIVNNKRVQLHGNVKFEDKSSRVGFVLVVDSKKMDPLSNAKYSREEPLFVWRYNFRYGDYNGKKTLTLLIYLSQAKNTTLWQKIVGLGNMSHSHGTCDFFDSKML